MMIKTDYSYFDLYGHPGELTEAEIKYFEETVSTIRNALSVEIGIYSCNHEREHKGKSKEALGIFYTSDLEDLKRECFITIDNFLFTSVMKKNIMEHLI